MYGRHIVNSFRFLNQIILNPTRHYFFPKQFTFIVLPAQQRNEFKSFPHHKWRYKKQQDAEFAKIKLLYIFALSFFIGDWLYTFQNNQNVMYFYYVSYPLAMKYLQTFVENTQKTIHPFLEIIPKQKFQVPLVWDRLKNLVFDTENRIKRKNQNVQKLKAEIDQFDKKLK